jgi:Bacterial protein of unknown function (DUF937)
MATSLVSLVMQFLTPDMIGRIAGALGLDRSHTQAAVGAAVPALLAEFSGVAAQPGGAQKLVDAARQQTGALGSFAGMIGGGSQSSLLERGSQMLGSLLGGREQTALAGAVGQYAGVGQSASGSLLGMLAPVVMGTIAEQQGARNLDAGHMASMLAGEKDNIAAALPAGFTSYLSGTGVADALGGAARTAAAAGRDAAYSAGSAARSVTDSGRRAAGDAVNSLSFLWWIIPLLALLVLIAYLLTRPTEEAGQQSATAVQSLTVGGVDIGRQVTDSIASLRGALGGVTDAASARAALPRLREVAAQVDRVDSLAMQLTAEQRRVLAGTVSPSLPALNRLIDRVLATPGVGEVLRPTLDSISARLRSFTA